MQITKFTGTTRDVAIIATKTWSESKKAIIQYDMGNGYKNIDIMNVMGNRVQSIKNSDSIELVSGREPLYVIGYK